MDHFRDIQGGDFYLETGGWNTNGSLPLLRFIAAHGYTDDLWAPTAVPAQELLHKAGLDWNVEVADIATARTYLVDGQPIPRYKALIRPDTGHVMDVVRSTYRAADNELVAQAALTVVQQASADGRLVGACAFGREHERTLFLAHVTGDVDSAVVLLVRNSHGGEGAVRFQLVHVDRGYGAVLVTGLREAERNVPHIGNISRAFEALARTEFVSRYLEAVEPLWAQLADALWTPRHTNHLVREFWGPTPDLSRGHSSVSGRLHLTGDPLVHPGRHLDALLAGCTDADTAFRKVCRFIDVESEARERGDYTKDRDERVACGAGQGLKQKIWKWLLDNT